MTGPGQERGCGECVRVHCNTMRKQSGNVWGRVGSTKLPTQGSFIIQFTMHYNPRFLRAAFVHTRGRARLPHLCAPCPDLCCTSVYW